MTQGERVRIVRKDLSLTLESFGKKLGVGKTAIYKIEKEENSLTDRMLNQFVASLMLTKIGLDLEKEICIFLLKMKLQKLFLVY